jgi:hypothetical protein
MPSMPERFSADSNIHALTPIKSPDWLWNLKIQEPTPGFLLSEFSPQRSDELRDSVHAANNELQSPSTEEDIYGSRRDQITTDEDERNELTDGLGLTQS